MKISVVIGTSVLGLFLGASTLVIAQHSQGGNQQGSSQGQQGQQGDHHRQGGGQQSGQQHGNQAQTSQQGQRHDQQTRGQRNDQQSRHVEQRHEERPRGPQHVERRPEPQMHREARGPERRDENWRNSRQRPEQRDIWYRHRSDRWEREHRSWHARGGYHGYRIPEDRFREHFGPRHWFRIHSMPVMVVEGYPRFQYGGFWFNLVDPWPGTWAPNWYQTDDVYVNYANDGYYLYNRRHPGVAIAINVSF